MDSKMKMEQRINCAVVRNREIEEVLKARGHFVVEHWRDGEKIGEYEFDNDIVNSGKNSILGIMFASATQIAGTSWCAGLISSVGYTALAATDVMSSHGGWTEFIGYSGGTRVAWGAGAAASQQITNATPMTFNITASGTVQGIFINSDATISGTVGTLWATGLFTAPVPVNNGDQLKVTYAVAC